MHSELVSSRMNSLDRNLISLGAATFGNTLSASHDSHDSRHTINVALIVTNTLRQSVNVLGRKWKTVQPWPQLLTHYVL